VTRCRPCTASGFLGSECCSRVSCCHASSVLGASFGAAVSAASRWQSCTQYASLCTPRALCCAWTHMVSVSHLCRLYTPRIVLRLDTHGFSDRHQSNTFCLCTPGLQVPEHTFQHVRRASWVQLLGGGQGRYVQVRSALQPPAWMCDGLRVPGAQGRKHADAGNGCQCGQVHGCQCMQTHAC